MESVLFQYFNALLILLCLGAFFIKKPQWIKVAAMLSVTLLFAYFSVLHDQAQQISNISLILINAFYLFKVFTVSQQP